MSNNKRIARRRQFECTAKLLLGDGHFLIASANDVTAGGMALVTSEPLMLGLSVVITFTLPSDGGLRPVSAKAVVRHSRKMAGGYHVGLQFVGIDSDSAWVIWEFASARPNADSLSDPA